MSALLLSMPLKRSHNFTRERTILYIKTEVISRYCDLYNVFDIIMQGISSWRMDWNTSMMVWPRKSSDSRVNFWRNFDLMSLSSSQTRTLMRSDELWHSLNHSLFKFMRNTLFNHVLFYTQLLELLIIIMN